MPTTIVFESSESFPSPSGTCRAAVSSQTSAPNQGLSQVVVSRPGGGSGLIAFDSPRVSMSFIWNSDEELIVRYPNDLPAPRIDATNRSFGPGGKGRVLYEAVPRNDIRPLRWTREGQLRMVAEERLERGTLLTFETGNRLEYSYSYYDVGEPDSSSERLRAQGLQGGGCTWEGIVYGLVALHAPDILEDLELDPEGDGLSVRSTNRAALITVAQLVAAAKRDRTLLETAIERARLDGQLE